MMKKLIISFLFFSTISVCYSQFLNTLDSTWRTYRKQLMFGGGATQFLGDLGGGEGPGKKFGMGDMDKKATSYEFHIGYRYLLNNYLALSSNLYLGQYKASDYYTQNYKRAPRKIDIKGSLIEFSQRIEFVFYSNYKEKMIKEKPKMNRFEIYAYSGIGFVYFNPQGGSNNRYEGTYLRQLHTEGQGMHNGTKEYNLYTVSIPFGFGIQKSISRRRSIRLELSYMKTFTDYMDDVSTNYYSYQVNDVPASPESIYFSNPAEDGPWQKYKDGDERGGKGKDCYFFASFTFVKAMGMRNKRIKKITDI